MVSYDNNSAKNPHSHNIAKYLLDTDNFWWNSKVPVTYTNITPKQLNSFENRMNSFEHSKQTKIDDARDKQIKLEM